MHHERTRIPRVNALRQIAKKCRQIRFHCSNKLRTGFGRIRREHKTNSFMLAHQNLRKRAHSGIITARCLVGFEFPCTHIHNILNNTRYDARQKILKFACGKRCGIRLLSLHGSVPAAFLANRIFQGLVDERFFHPLSFHGSSGSQRALMPKIFSAQPSIQAWSVS